jgi:hypothetical protein
MDGLQQSNPNWCWMTVHYAVTVGMPSILSPPSFLGISTVLTKRVTVPPLPRPARSLMTSGRDNSGTRQISGAVAPEDM